MASGEGPHQYRMDDYVGKALTSKGHLVRD